MCGFFGVVDFSGTISKSDQEEIINGAKAISYRGPDDNAYHSRQKICIAFQRLSIIDTSKSNYYMHLISKPLSLVFLRYF